MNAGDYNKLDDNQQLAVEYRQWRFSKDLSDNYIQKITNAIGARTLNSYDKADYLNCLDRWMIALQFNNFENRNINLPIFPQNINVNDASCEQLNKELFQRIYQYDGKLINFLIDEINRFHDRCDKESIDDLLVPRVECKDKSKDSIEMEIGEAGDKKLVTPCCPQLHFMVNKYGPIKTAIVVLRYEALGLRTQQWALSKRVSDLYRTEFNVKNEAFCLPLQTPFLDKSDVKFYTTFDDIDSFLGSAGNSFALNYKEQSGGWSVNPHFINQLLNDSARKMLDVLDSDNCQSYFLAIYPSWADNEGYKMLNSSEHKIERIDFKKREFIIQDAYGFELRPNNRISLFIMGNKSMPIDLQDKIHLIRNAIQGR